MTEVVFHVNVADKLFFSCRLVRKTYVHGANIVVTAEPALLAQLDAMLRTFSPVDFVPHCKVSAVETTAAESPVLLAEALGDCKGHNILINLGQGIPLGFERFARFIEVASDTKEDLVAARLRWRHYADRGYALTRHDHAAAGERA